MSRRRHDRWLLIRLAAQNVGRRRLRAIFLGLAVMLGVGIGFASFVAGWALRDGMARSFSRMGADLLVVMGSVLLRGTSGSRATISNRMAPSVYTSVRIPMRACSPRTCSGAM